MREAFIQFDYDNDGQIRLTEFKKGMQLIGMALLDSEAKEVFQFLDKNANGTLSYQEFSTCFDSYTMSKTKLDEAKLKLLSHATPVQNL